MVNGGWWMAKTFLPSTIHHSPFTSCLQLGRARAQNPLDARNLLSLGCPGTRHHGGAMSRGRVIVELAAGSRTLTVRRDGERSCNAVTIEAAWRTALAIDGLSTLPRGKIVVEFEPGGDALYLRSDGWR